VNLCVGMYNICDLYVCMCMHVMNSARLSMIHVREFMFVSANLRCMKPLWTNVNIVIRPPRACIQNFAKMMFRVYVLVDIHTNTHCVQVMRMYRYNPHDIGILRT
jgi:hypothetical protein